YTQKLRTEEEKHSFEWTHWNFGESPTKTNLSNTTTQERAETKQNRLVGFQYTYRGRLLQKGFTSSRLGSEKRYFEFQGKFSNF
ncbi:hypothetical protein, partial [Salmonella enterica]|uniref:hypothetical protein n=1 Tax=Salmonella enterica TaxID=28901 RepID=UPI0035239140